ncbi:alpha-1,2-fucosyltransferase [Nitratidesulfovibrio termitidis]|uniref:alpha-1,2-fucosyltransferase n=1 Tax=Nitratidesulfovibrio termitidis TaxID=42252 RepID=UPI000A01F927|nr:alpha-1,2-fucosyltransferase [Nitratidesulfovibrio termitidis]
MTSHVVVAAIRGGLGNQMFQYAAGRALASRLGVELKLDLSWFSSVPCGATPRRFMLDAFPNINIVEATGRECESLIYAPGSFFARLLRWPRRYAQSYYVEPHFGYWEGFEQIVSPAYLLGYWQNERYFSGFAEIIRHDFGFPPLPSGVVKEVAGHIRGSRHAVAVHIRRGDYVSNPSTFQWHGLCVLDYYYAALEVIAAQIGSAPELFLFSDDPGWVRENFDTRGMSSVVLDFQAHVDAPCYDMHLMSLCTHHVIANSSFSWWGAWLSGGNGVICAPNRWFADERRKYDNPSPYAWVRL